MTDDGMNDASEARARARALLAKSAERRAAEPERRPAPETAATVGPLERIGGLHDLLRDMAAYLGDRPNRDAEAMALYGRVMRMLGNNHAG